MRTLVGASVVLAIASACGAGPSTPDAFAPSDAGLDAATPHDAGPNDAPAFDVWRNPDTGTDAAFVPAPHEALPIFPNQGGHVIAHPAIVTITFAGDTRAAQLEAYVAWLVGSSWLTTVGADYGVGSATVLGNVRRSEAALPMVTGADIEAMIAAGVADHSLPVPASGIQDAIYVLFYPSTTTVTERCGVFPALESCTTFAGVHTDGVAGGTGFAYAVLPDCGASGGLSAIENVEVSASHEIIEAATDPLSSSAPAYQLHEDPTDPWFTSLGCEVENADLCAFPLSVTTESGHVAQRNWSNSAAAAGMDPCVPADPTRPYVGVTATPTTVQHLAPGASVTYTLHAWSTVATPTWTLSVVEYGPIDGSPQLHPTLVLSSAHVRNGDAPTLRVTLPAGSAAGSDTLFVVSTDARGDVSTWPLGIVSP